MPTGQKRGPCRGTKHGGISILKPDTFFGQPVNIRSCDDLLSLVTQKPDPQVIGINQNNIGIF